MSRPPSDPELKARIRNLLHKKGTHYEPDVLNPGGIVVQAHSSAELQETLGIEIAHRHFRSALGSLMYKDEAVVRCHIDGERHYKLLD